MGIELYYWPSIPGRGELVRWILEDLGLDYTDVARRDGVEAIFTARRDGIALADGRRVPIFAPPALATGELVISQTALIAQHLGESHGLAPADGADRWEARSLMGFVMDVVKEVHDVHHPVCTSLTYEEQAEEARRAAVTFVANRLPVFLGFLERRLGEGSTVDEVNESRPSRGRALVAPFLFGAEPSYVDIALAPLLRGLDHMFPRAMAEASIPKQRALAAAIEARPRIAAYLASERCVPFNRDGIFRYYPDLDVAQR